MKDGDGRSTANPCTCHLMAEQGTVRATHRHKAGKLRVRHATALPRRDPGHTHASWSRSKVAKKHDLEDTAWCAGRLQAESPSGWSLGLEGVVPTGTRSRARRPWVCLAESLVPPSPNSWMGWLPGDQRTPQCPLASPTWLARQGPGG